MWTRGLGALTHPEGNDQLATAEFRVLRETVLSRGNLRIGVFVGGLAGWAGALLAVLAFLPNPLLALVPLTVLVGVFEAIRAIHFGVERVGRYLQVFFEEPAQPPGATLRAPAWERAVVRVGGRLPGAAGHPLFIPLFLLATIVNTLAVLLPGPTPIEAVPLFVAHAAFVAWMLHADRGVRAQRAHDEARFRGIRDNTGT